MTDAIQRRAFLTTGARAVMGLALVPSSRLFASPSFDLVLRGGTVVDGTGGPIWKGDVGIVGDTIRAIGTIDPGQATRVIDATGLSVSPGFIDIHSHSDGTILEYPGAESRVTQGVTTEVTGNCGSSAVPRESDEGEWIDLMAYRQQVESNGMAVNHASLVGHGTLRRLVAGSENRPLSPAERAEQVGYLEEALDLGAFGLSTGLEYVPGRFTPMEEIVELAGVVARRGALYASHIRNEESTLLEAVNEALEVGRACGGRVQLSHLKAAGRPNWGKQRAALHLLEGARRDGIDVWADAYPYTAYSTGISIFLPEWAAAGGREQLLARLADPDMRARIRTELDARVALDPGSYDLIVLSSVGADSLQGTVGKDLETVAAEWNLEPVDALIRLLESGGGVGFIGHGMSEMNVEMVLGHPLVMIGSDGASMAPTGEAARTRPHPRSYGTFTRVLGRYCREKGTFDLATAIRKMTGLPAAQLDVQDRGTVARGKKADLVVFDPGLTQDQATFQEPHQYSSGIHSVVVNGIETLAEGALTGHRPGRILERGT